MADETAGLLIAVPLYRSEQLIAPLFDALAAMADEIRALGGRLLLVNDSPGDAPLAATLAARLPELAGAIDVELVENAENLGFVRSANRAMTIARDTGADIILLNSDALPTPGAFAEMVAVSRIDPMTSVVSPRSDNATICNSPWMDPLRTDPQAALAGHRSIQRLLPRVTYVPTAVGFCLLIRNLMLREFGLFDEAYGTGYNEENDFIRRCNRRGYRAMLANHAYVIHAGSVSFVAAEASRDERDRITAAILDARYPEYRTAVDRYFNNADFHAQRLLSGMVPDADGRLRFLFDARAIGTRSGAIVEQARALMTAFAAKHSDRFAIDILASPEAIALHRLDEIVGIGVPDPATVVTPPCAHLPYAIAFRIDQPVAVDDVTSLARFAPITGALILDTIAMDCQQLDDSNVEAIWQALLDTASLIGFSSAATRARFRRRFALPPETTDFVSRSSTDVADYRPGIPADGGHVLLVGDRFPHDHVRETLAAIRSADPEAQIRVLGVALEPEPGVRGFEAGSIPQTDVDAMYDRASAVVYPSHHDGSGLPIMHALARRRPVIARDTPTAREIASRTPFGGNIHLFATTEEIAARAVDPPAWSDDEGDAMPGDWTTAAAALADACERAIAFFDFRTLQRQQARAIMLAQGWDARTMLAETRRTLAEVDARAAMLAEAEARGREALAETEARGQEALAEAERHAQRMLEEASARAAEVLADAEARASDAARRADMADGLLAAIAPAPVAAASLAAPRGWFARRPRFRPSETPPTDDRSRDDIELDAREMPEAAIASPLLDWARRLAMGGTLRLLVDRDQPIEPRLRAIGFVVRRRKASVVEAVKIVDWSHILPGPPEDAAFVRLAFLTALGREPDEDGARSYAADLASGQTREDVMRSLYLSDERLARFGY